MIQSDPDPDDTDEEPDLFYNKQGTLVPAFIANKRQIEGSIELRLDNDVGIKHDMLSFSDDIPRLNLNINTMNTLTMVTDLLKGIDLKMKVNSGLFSSIINYGNEIVYNDENAAGFTKHVLKRKGYLIEESNYFNVNTDKLSYETNVLALVNTRVILFWKDIRLNDIVKKRIITLGLAFLINKISLAELYFFIREALPPLSCEVSVSYKKNTYVLIGVEGPIFSH